MTYMMADVQTNQREGQSCPEASPLVQAGLQSRVLLPANELYAARVDSYWCNSAKLQPACIFQPRSADEVSKAVAALAQARQPFAVRAGGHGNSGGNNNIAGGVTIDLGLLNATGYDAETQTAHLEPGAKWKDVYAELDKHGRVVAGAREAEVGVGGFLLGGGNTFYTSRYGFACDNVVAYEVVLADGRIITVEANGEHAELFRALKGGGNNFGIVTRFTLRTFPSGPVWGGIALRPLTVVPEAVDALVEFTANNHTDLDSNLQFVVGHQPRFGGGVGITLCNNMAGIEKPPVLQRSVDLPEMMNNFSKTTLQEILPLASLPTNYFNIWFTLTFKNDASIVLKAAELHNKLAKELQEKIPDQDFTSHVAFQPLPRLLAQQSQIYSGGGNVLGLERNAHDGILVQAAVSVRTCELAQWARPKVRALVDEVRAFADTIEGGNLPWIYMNYAHSSQDVLRSYGPDNLKRLREVALAYDPQGVFQHLCPGGFKISAVEE